MSKPTNLILIVVLFSILFLFSISLNPVQSVPMNLTQYGQSNTSTAVVNGSVNFPNSTLIEANSTNIRLTFNITHGGGIDVIQASILQTTSNISRVTITLPNDYTPGKTNFTFIASSNATTVSPPNLHQFFNETRGGNFNDVSINSVVNLTWNRTTVTGEVFNIIQNQSGNGYNTSRNFTFNVSAPNKTGTYLFNISTWNTTGGDPLDGGDYNVTAFYTTVVDRTPPSSFNLLVSPTNDSFNDTIWFKYSLVEPGFGGTNGKCGNILVGHNYSTNQSISEVVANNTILSTTAAGAVVCDASFNLASSGTNGSINFTINYTDQSGNIPSRSNMTFTVFRGTYGGSTAAAATPTPTAQPGYVKSTSTTASNPDVLASKTLIVRESATPAKPLDLTPSTELIAQGLTKIQIQVSKEVAAADATVEVKALKQIPTTDEAGQTLTALPSGSQLPLKVLQITPSATLRNSTSKALITFTLNKTELEGIDPNNVVLARFSEGTWAELPTTITETKAGTPFYGDPKIAMLFVTALLVLFTGFSSIGFLKTEENGAKRIIQMAKTLHGRASPSRRQYKVVLISVIVLVSVSFLFNFNPSSFIIGNGLADGSVQFTAETPGFSVFVVTTKAPAVQSEPTITEKPSPIAETTTTPATSPVPAKEKTPDLSILYLAGVAVIVLVLLVFGIKKRKHRKK